MIDLAHHPLAEHFKELNPHSVLKEVEKAGFSPSGRMMPLNSYENRVYQIETEGECDLVVKFYRPGRWSLEAIEAEHDFIYELDEGGLPVACPIILPGDYTVGTLTEEAEGIHYCIYERASGRVNDEPSEADLRTLGEYLALMHAVGEGADAPCRGQLSVQTYGWTSLDILESSQTMPAQWRASYRNTVEPLLNLLERRFDDVAVHRIHGDCHHGNLLWGRDGPIFLDFDDFCVGPAVQDIWLLASEPGSEGDRKRNIILDGYSRHRRLDSDALSLVEPLRALRMLRYSAWIASRWHDSTFQKTFSNFGSDQWWSDEISSLKEQYSRIHDGALSL